MAERILFVDDEPAVLEGFKRNLYREFEIDTAAGGELGLASIRDRGPYAVVVSDMRMPVMDGAKFLAQARQMAPDTVRMLLTGYSDINAAIEAVNQGSIFRFLTKPCEKEVLTKALADGLTQYRLIIAEQALLEQTLMASIKALTEVLSAASPEGFGRSMRIARYVRFLVTRFNLPGGWRFEAAAMLSQLGCVVLDPEIVRASHDGEQLSEEKAARFANHPLIAKDLLVHIPRLEPIAWMISQQLSKASLQSAPAAPPGCGDDVMLGARILRLAVALDVLKSKGVSDAEAFAALSHRRSEFGTELVEALKDIRPESPKRETRKLAVSKLAPGMILQHEIRTKSGMLVVPSGHEITQALLIKLDNYAQAGTIEREVSVLIPT